MPDLALALLALTPPGDDGVRLDAPPKPGTVVTKPIEVTGETQALEGVLKVELFVVRGQSLRLVETYAPPVPVGTVPFELTFDPKGMVAGRVTIRVVATTLTRGFSAEIPGLVVPPAARPKPLLTMPAPRVAARPAPVVRRVAAPPVAPVVDDSGRAFGRTAPVLPYRPPAPPPPPGRSLAPAPVAAPEPVPPERSAWASVAAGLLLLLTSWHMHRALRTQPDQRDAEGDGCCSSPPRRWCCRRGRRTPPPCASTWWTTRSSRSPRPSPSATS